MKIRLNVKFASCTSHTDGRTDRHGHYISSYNVLDETFLIDGSRCQLKLSEAAESNQRPLYTQFYAIPSV